MTRLTDAELEQLQDLARVSRELCATHFKDDGEDSDARRFGRFECAIVELRERRAADCKTCHGTGFVGHPPDQFEECPQCTAISEMQKRAADWKATHDQLRSINSRQADMANALADCQELLNEMTGDDSGCSRVAIEAQMNINARALRVWCGSSPPSKPQRTDAERVAWALCNTGKKVYANIRLHAVTGVQFLLYNESVSLNGPVSRLAIVEGIVQMDDAARATIDAAMDAGKEKGT